ncbi:MAG: 6-carboxytetrahydropterin synthase QueD [Candidatus Margulisiibacteriota bacterium]|nr:MAG: 6-carboxytetrahydropterin synthase QueD [Candidatus Margulisbacteria bacterium GWD2_39_127]OGI02888.1 MAG: 6-carboxytetrahydropterin synthase QueD [Candidatus Margulisbacteria bacterium GWF2_38_17]OGI06816.1 MAG: 6-carboxytetrahydropterin synthase QueD [Candidatus Margulisbacteria bacterium GWE2_39_32]PZM83004.1 MAG: 6-carboxytetrahydropterin synthase QueD [Candidatus Margulisiibacteriota bacterium]HAR62164.1 6-carboxytetrahydropterin synthase QueD [Candidatus Margulisiibacteriota bacte
MFSLMVEDTFSAAHQLYDYKGPCENLHGHTWKIQLFVEGDVLDKAGMLVDFRVLKAILKEERDILDHSYLNKIVEFSPTSENLSKYLFERISLKMPENVHLKKVTIWESASTWASYSQ